MINEVVTVFAAGLFVGLLGSFHCVGMCGPLAMIFPISNNNGKVSTLKVMAYNLGRTLTYAILGAIFGLIGKSFSLFGWQQSLSILCGVIMLLFVLLKYNKSFHLKFATSFNIKLQNAISKYIKKTNSVTAIFTIGLLNGLLPCGLVYVALTAATATGNTLLGVIWMIAFGFGTIPALAIVMYMQKLITLQTRKKINKITPIVIVFFAIILIMRGLNLGIPYLSPQMISKTSQIVKCH